MIVDAIKTQAIHRGRHGSHGNIYPGQQQAAAGQLGGYQGNPAPGQGQHGASQHGSYLENASFGQGQTTAGPQVRYPNFHDLLSPTAPGRNQNTAGQQGRHQGHLRHRQNQNAFGQQGGYQGNPSPVPIQSAAAQQEMYRDHHGKIVRIPGRNRTAHGYPFSNTSLPVHPLPARPQYSPP